MKALYIRRDGSIQIKDPMAAPGGGPLRVVKEAVFRRLRATIDVDTDLLPPNLSFDERTFFWRGELAGQYHVYEEV